MNERISVKSMSSGKISINLPDLRFKREWPRKGAVVNIERDLLKEAIYDPGVEYMLNNGLLYIEDMDFKKEIGLEPEDAEKPVNIVPLEEKTMQRYLKVMPVAELSEVLDTLNYEQKRILVNYAIQNELVSMDRVDLIKEKCGVDLLKAISQKKQNEEE